MIDFFLAMCVSVVFLTTFEPLDLIIEFKPPVIKPLIISSRELFAKRGRDEKSTETESSKTPMLLSFNLSPEAKKRKTDIPVTNVKSDSLRPS